MYANQGKQFKYPVAIDMVIKAADALGIKAAVLDERSGFLVRVERNGRSRLIMPNCFPLNDEVSSAIARDKSFTYMACEDAGIPVPDGAYFFTGDFQGYGVGRSVPDALRFAGERGYPLVFKPNQLSKGKHVRLVHDEVDVVRAVADLGSEDHAFILQRPIHGDDFRVVLLDGRVLLAYQRLPLEIVGDGAATVRELIARKTPADAGSGDEAARRLADAGLTLESVLPAGSTFMLTAINKNLNAGGVARECTEGVPEPVAAAARRVCAALGLRLAGVDCILEGSTPVIIEVNSKPMMTSFYEQNPAGRGLVERAYREIVKALF